MFLALNLFEKDRRGWVLGSRLLVRLLGFIRLSWMASGLRVEIGVGVYLCGGPQVPTMKNLGGKKVTL